MSKRTYKKVQIKRVDVEQLASTLKGQRVVVAVDVAKTDMVAALADADARVLATVSWTSPDESEAFFAMLGTLVDAGARLEAVMESTGSYGDALRYQLCARGVPVFRVGTKRTHDAAEVYDGVASMHDAKAAAIIAKLHVDGRSRPWPVDSDERRKTRAAVSQMDLYKGMLQRLLGQLEGQLARYWPEVTELVKLKSATLLALLARIGGPADVAADVAAARILMRSVGRGLLKDDKISRVLASASATIGVPMLEQERELLKCLAAEAHRVLKEMKSATRRVEALSEHGAARHLAPVVGKATAVVLVADVGDPSEFAAARAYVKAYGLNLTEKSSGKKKGRLKTSKRGPGRARRYLWLATLRWLKADPIARAWYVKKIARDGGRKMCGIVALMRKLAKALFHISRGAPFDSSKLFDVSRLRPATSS